MNTVKRKEFFRSIKKDFKSLKTNYSKKPLSFKLLDSSYKIYSEFLKEISKAKKSIFLEVYIYQRDSLGQRFLELLTKKASEGLRVELLIDDWGKRKVDLEYFKEFRKAGGIVTFFNKVKLSSLKKGFMHYFHRDHRKLLLIDERIAFVGSINITHHSFKQRELVLKIVGEDVKVFKRIFLQNKSAARRFFEWKVLFSKNDKKFSAVKLNNLKIIRSIPFIANKRVRKEYINLISKAKKNILIETAYLVPDFKIRKALADASKRGVNVSIITSIRSNHVILDIIAGNFFRFYYNNGIKLYFYPAMLHSKCMVVDDYVAIIGSTNLDYLSLNNLFELDLVVYDYKTVHAIKSSILHSRRISVKFNIDEWKQRPFIRKVLEKILFVFRGLF